MAMAAHTTESDSPQANHTDGICAPPTAPQQTLFAAPYGQVRCSECGEMRAISDFAPNRYLRSGRQAYCRLCNKAHGRLRRGVHPDDCRLEPAPGQGCEICGAVPGPDDRDLDLDHDHTTGRFRGWLCSRCNSAIGHLRDDVELAQRAWRYLEARR